jgi:hypothetical protein
MNARTLSALASSLNKDKKKEPKEQPLSYSRKKFNKLVLFLEAKRQSGQEYCNLTELLLFIAHEYKIPMQKDTKNN